VLKRKQHSRQRENFCYREGAGQAFEALKKYSLLEQQGGASGLNIAEKTVSAAVKGNGKSRLSAVKGAGAVGFARVHCYVHSLSKSSEHSPIPCHIVDSLPSSPRDVWCGTASPMIEASKTPTPSILNAVGKASMCC
jgi:hypothetical protein